MIEMVEMGSPIGGVGIVIPCHRVARAGGNLGDYGGGVARKRWLLDHEMSRE